MLHSVRIKRLTAWLAISVFALLAAGPQAALAQGLQISTAYPAVTVDPGGAATFPLTIVTDTPQRVDLAVTGLPEGWQARLRGGGSTVDAVTTGGAEPPEVALEVDIPLDAAAGAQQVVLEARTPTETQQLMLDIQVEAVEAGSVTLTTEHSSLRGDAGANFSFDLELANNTNQETTFSFETQGPRGWRVDARPSGETQAATTDVAAGGTARLDVTADPPTDVTAGQYAMVVRAVGGPQPLEVELTVEITGNPSVALTTADERLNARVTVGGSSPITLIVRNDGSAPLTEISVSGTPPRGWTVDFAPATIDQLAPDESREVVATLTAADDAIAGDYQVSMRASAEGADDSIELRTTVEASPIGGFIGLGLLALVAVGLLFVFRRYGRR